MWDNVSGTDSLFRGGVANRIKLYLFVRVRMGGRVFP